ncbi:MAG: cell division/cell wall cluster transcriptional repressor MraZ [Coxiella sp. RIFCSPHIGHO2_12_FULL_42_15]|nr:MAG: cell division/cell wall cluster transcriptional repressor MraZ [Coxiella sp. RIFCSPHIGHO2_12_FULL_42_15]
MFRGLNAVTIDDKGRLAVPARYRDVIQEEADGVLVVTIDPEERCLLLYSNPQWEEIEAKLSSLPSFNPAARRIQRLLIGHATELEMDRHARILIPPLLREYAGIDKAVMLVGQGNKFEIWGEAQWELARESWLADGLTDNDGEIPGELRSLSL